MVPQTLNRLVGSKSLHTLHKYKTSGTTTHVEVAETYIAVRTGATMCARRPLNNSESENHKEHKAIPETSRMHRSASNQKQSNMSFLLDGSAAALDYYSAKAGSLNNSTTEPSASTCQPRLAKTLKPKPGNSVGCMVADCDCKCLSPQAREAPLLLS